ncbi:MAG: Hpt domain-containing protein [Pseudobdellovibrio sp.]
MKHYNIPEELRDLIPGYLERRRLEIEDLRLFLSERDYETIGKIGHKLKGNGSSFGFDHITELGELIMIAAKNKNSVEIEKLIIELEKEVAEIRLAPEVNFSE